MDTPKLCKRCGQELKFIKEEKRYSKQCSKCGYTEWSTVILYWLIAAVLVPFAVLVILKPGAIASFYGLDFLYEDMKCLWTAAGIVLGILAGWMLGTAINAVKVNLKPYAPDRPTTAPTPSSGSRSATATSGKRGQGAPLSLEKVTFSEEKRTAIMPGYTQVYRVYRAPDMRTAKAYLAANPVTRMLEYLIVETPQGAIGRDISGAFIESTGAEISLEDVEGITTGTLVWYAPTGLHGGLWLTKEARAHQLSPDGSRLRSYTASFDPRDPRGETIAAIFPQLPAGAYEIECPGVPSGLGLRRVTIRVGTVTEVDKPDGSSK